MVDLGCRGDKKQAWGVVLAVEVVTDAGESKLRRYYGLGNDFSHLLIEGRQLKLVLCFLLLLGFQFHQLIDASA